MTIPDSTRRHLLSSATAALHELLKDNGIDHVTYDQIEDAQRMLLEAYGKLERWGRVTA